MLSHATEDRGDSPISFFFLYHLAGFDAALPTADADCDTPRRDRSPLEEIRARSSAAHAAALSKVSRRSAVQLHLPTLLGKSAAGIHLHKTLVYCRGGGLSRALMSRAQTVDTICPGSDLSKQHCETLLDKIEGAALCGRSRPTW